MNYPETLDNTPDKQLEYYWADYIELLCLANPDKMISKADFIRRIQRHTNDFSGPMDDPSIEQELYEDKQGKIDASESGLDDKWTIRTNDYFKFLSSRQKMFGNFYPFELSANKKILTTKDSFSDQQKLYLFLLFSSNLKYFDRSQRQTLTGSFEKLCVAATKSFFYGWNIHSFGVGAEMDSKYKGTLWEKINSLSQDLCGKLICDEKDFPPQNSGDGGIDIVGWKNFEDFQDGFPIIFGQCACTKTWDIKQHSSNQERWGERIKTKAPPINLIYAPICFRKANGDWYRSDEIRKSILVDRLRLKEIFPDIETFQTCLSYEVVNELILLEESVI